MVGATHQWKILIGLVMHSEDVVEHQPRIIADEVGIAQKNRLHHLIQLVFEVLGVEECPPPRVEILGGHVDEKVRKIIDVVREDLVEGVMAEIDKRLLVLYFAELDNRSRVLLGCMWFVKHRWLLCCFGHDRLLSCWIRYLIGSDDMDLCV